MREQYERELDEMQQALTEMGETCGQAIDITRRSLEQGNVDVLSDVEKKEETINKMERDIENRCIQLLLLQQPVATDLRRVSSALKMVTDFERIGDHAHDIADILKHGNAKEFSDIHLVAQMAQKTEDMVKNCVDAFLHQNLEEAREVVAADDDVDGLFMEMRKALSDELADHKAVGDEPLDLLMIAKYYERIGDHAVNLANWVIYSITGKLDTE